MPLRRAWKLYNEGGLTHLRNETGWFFWRTIGRQLFRSPDFGHWFFRNSMNIHRQIGFSRYTDANPFKKIYVDPNSIDYYYSGPPRGWGRVVDGDWDLERERLYERPLFSAVEDHFIHGKDWEKTELWEDYLSRGWSEEKIRKNLKQIENLYETLKANGYKTQEELFHQNPERAYRSNNDAIHPYLNEVAVNISRDGKLGKKYSGNHRLALARVLNINKMPVLIRTRHYKWQQIRNQIRQSENPPEGINYSHPDLQDIINE